MKSLDGKSKPRQRYDRLRAVEYPDLPEQIGAIMKALVALQEGNPIPEDALAVIKQVDDVKTKFPKVPKKKPNKDK